MGSISLLIPGFPSANLAVQEELPSVFILSWTLLSNHAKLLRLIFPTIKEQKNMGLPARTPKQAVQKELEHQRGLCEGNGFVVGPVPKRIGDRLGRKTDTVLRKSKGD